MQLRITRARSDILFLFSLLLQIVVVTGNFRLTFDYTKVHRRPSSHTIGRARTRYVRYTGGCLTRTIFKRSSERAVVLSGSLLILISHTRSRRCTALGERCRTGCLPSGCLASFQGESACDASAAISRTERILRGPSSTPRSCNAVREPRADEPF